MYYVIVVEFHDSSIRTIERSLWYFAPSSPQFIEILHDKEGIVKTFIPSSSIKRFTSIMMEEEEDHVQTQE